jgi:hypothetical protein
MTSVINPFCTRLQDKRKKGRRDEESPSVAIPSSDSVVDCPTQFSHNSSGTSLEQRSPPRKPRLGLAGFAKRKTHPPMKEMGLRCQSESFKQPSSSAEPSAVRWLRCRRGRRWMVLVLIEVYIVGRLGMKRGQCSKSRHRQLIL